MAIQKYTCTSIHKHTLFLYFFFFFLKAKKKQNKTKQTKQTIKHIEK